MKKALILTYYWPPGSGPGVQRWLKFCKYLPEFGWDTKVITVNNGSYPSVDSSLENDIPEGLEIHKTKTIEPFAIYNALRGKKGKSVEVALASVKGKQSPFSKFANYVRSNYFIPDARVGWNTYSFPKAIELIKKDRPDVIITTGPPHSTHLVGQRLHKMFDIPWVADFRDPWTTIYYNQFLLRTDSSIRKDKALEDLVLSEASALVTATPGMKAEYEERANSVQFLTNGFDQSDFPEDILPREETFTISYVGNFKPIQNIEILWQALKDLSTEGASLKLQITGNVAEEVSKSILTHGLDHMLEVLPFVPHHESIKRMMSAHILLLPIPQDASSKLILTGKIFEYLATRRPILSIGPPHGNASSILDDCEKESMIDYKDLEGLKMQIKTQLDLWSSGQYEPISGNDNYTKYSRKGVTESLAQLLNTLVE